MITLFLGESTRIPSVVPSDVVLATASETIPKSVTSTEEPETEVALT